MPSHRRGNYRIGGTAALAVLFFISAGALLAAGQVAVTTYHYDNNRTGWNKHETVLTPANVGTSSFGWLRTVVLDDQVDAQPLVVPGVLITAGQFQGAARCGLCGDGTQHGVRNRRSQRDSAVEPESRTAGAASVGMHE